MVKKAKKKQLFVVGSRRSGTTWMTWMLGQHPDVVACHHLGLFHHINSLKEWWQKESKYGKYIMPSLIEKDPGDQAGEFSKAGISISSILSVNDFYDLSRPLATRVFDDVAGTREKVEVVVEQTPENLRLANLITELFPDAYFLHVIRDPRSVFNSHRAAAKSWNPVDFTASPREIIREWLSDVRAGQDISLMTDHYREVRYEELTDQGPEELEKIFSWLNLKSDNQLCVDIVNACKIDKLRKTKSCPPGFYRKGQKDSWREAVSARHLRSIEYIAGDLMKELGYKNSQVTSNQKPFQLWLHEKYAAGISYTLNMILRAGQTNPLVKMRGSIPQLDRFIRYIKKVEYRRAEAEQRFFHSPPSTVEQK